MKATRLAIHREAARVSFPPGAWLSGLNKCTLANILAIRVPRVVRRAYPARAAT